MIGFSSLLLWLLSISFLCPSKSSPIPTLSPSPTVYFVASNVADLCSTNQMTTLLTSAACSTAAGSLSLTFAGGISLSNAPLGCFFALTGFLGHTSDKVFFNTGATANTVSSYGNTYVVCFVGSVNPTRQPSLSPTAPPSLSPTLSPTAPPSLSPTLSPTAPPSLSPTAPPSLSPTAPPSLSPTAPIPTFFGFGVEIGDERILSAGKAILVDYLQDARRGESYPLPFSDCFFVSGKMIPISHIVNSSRVSLDSDPPLSSDSILIKWRPVKVSGIGSWDTNSYTILTIPGGVFLSWLVSLSSEEIRGFIIEGLYSSSPFFLHHRLFRYHLLPLSHLFHPILFLRSCHLSLYLQQDYLISDNSRVYSWGLCPASLSSELGVGQMR
jgi:hypothetical protein